MTRKLTKVVGRSLRRLALGLTLGLASYSLAAMEELTVDGAKEAAQVRVQRALFVSQMEAYGKAVGVEFRDVLKTELKQAVSNEARLAAIKPRSGRG